MIQTIFTTVTAVITAFAQCIAQAFTSVMAIVWDSEGSTLTAFGTLLLIAFGVGLVYFALNYIVRLISLRKAK